MNGSLLRRPRRSSEFLFFRRPFSSPAFRTVWKYAFFALFSTVFGINSLVTTRAEIARAPASTEISTVADFYHTASWNLRAPPRVQLEGVVTLIDAARQLLVIQADGSAIGLHSAAFHTAAHVGDLVRVEALEAFPSHPGIPGFPFSPTRHEILNAFEIRGIWWSHYVDRARAYLVPPTDGVYQFWIASDDTSELWLSENESPGKARRIARAPAFTEEREWTRFPSQRSEPIALEGGHVYYIEAVHEQGVGPDHLAVAWQGPSIPKAVINGAFLRPWLRHRGHDEALQFSSPVVEGTQGLLREYWRYSEISDIADIQPELAATSIVELSEPKITVLRSGVGLPSPQTIALGQVLPPDQAFRWCEVTGAVTSVSSSGEALHLELSSGGKSLVVHIQHWTGPSPLHLRGDTLRLAGVCEGAREAGGSSVAATLWVPTADQDAIAAASPDWAGVTPYYISELGAPPLSDNPEFRVKLRGRVRRQSSARSLLVEDEGCFIAQTSVDGVNWKEFGNPINVPMPDSVYVGLAVVSHHDEESATARFDSVQGLADNAQSIQIGSTLPAGAFSREGNSFTVTGRGGDIWERPDQFYFVYQPLIGDGEIVARLTPLKRPSVWTKAGLMIRESLAPDSAFIDLVDVGAPRIGLQWRLADPGSRPGSIYSPLPNVPLWLKLVRKHHSISVKMAQDLLVQPGQRVEVLGYFNPREPSAGVTDGFVQELPSSGTATPDEMKLRPLIEISTLLSVDPAHRPNALRIRGVVTCTRQVAGQFYLAIQDATAGVFLRRFVGEEGQGPQPGDLVEAYSNSGPNESGNRHELVAWKVVTLGRGVMPTPLPHPTEFLAADKGEGRWIEIEGVVYSVREDGSAVLRGTSGDFSAQIPSWKQEQWTALIDSKVRLRGVVSYLPSSEFRLLTPGPEHLEIVEPPPPLDLSSRPRPIAELAALSAAKGTFHRCRISGVITYAEDRLLVVEDASGAASVRTTTPSLAKVGEEVEVSGFPETSVDAPLDLSQATVRVLGPARLPKPPHISISDLIDGKFGVRLVTIEAVLTQKLPGTTGIILELQGDRRTFRAWCSSRDPELLSIPEGSWLQLTGISYHEPRPLSLTTLAVAPSATQFNFLTRISGDVVVLERPSWWRLRRALFALGGLGIVLLVTILWVQMLRARIRERTRELKATMECLQRETELAATLSERNRIAGEIHDSLEQGFSGLMLQLDATLRLPSCPPEVRENLHLARGMVSFSHAEVRHSVWNLQSPTLDETDLRTALLRIAHQLSSDSPVITVEVGGPVPPSPSPIDHHLLRVAQEAMTNAVKHAKARRIEVRLNYATTSIALTIRDDGCGFQTSVVLAGTQGHFGLRSLRTRAKSINGELRINSQPAEGTLVELIVPLPTA